VILTKDPAQVEIERLMEFGLIRYTILKGQDGLTLTPYGMATLEFLQTIKNTAKKD